MTLSLSPEQEAARLAFRAFVDEHIAPFADEFHRAQRTPPELVGQLAERGYLGRTIPKEYGGGGADAVTLGLLAGELGRGCSSVRSLLTVHTMVAQAILRWGSRAQRETWLPQLASGARIGALALSEPDIGSDAKSVRTLLRPDGDDIVVTGHKSWITYGQVASLFLLFGRTEEGPTAILVERERPGFETSPILDLMGIRASMTASVRLRDCRVPATHIVGRRGLGISQVASMALDLGRYTVAWGSVGILRACLEACVAYTGHREQFGVLLKEHQLVRHMVSDMYTALHASEMLCMEAGRLRDRKDPGALAATSVAKYFASTAAVRAAGDAVQLHGANGVSGDYPLQRYLGDAKIMEIIEGSSQIQQITLAEYAYQEYAGAVRAMGGTASWRKP
ncbi:acyl-CoA dehydrogenase family protein [Pendulispora albinea]|uniref:Acyl-CoA dehydrogenase family protein n=1 Tax=Pendulispora albinea TaxID=2741071 RepID=A0ABZ2LMY8_9BACT